MNAGMLHVYRETLDTSVRLGVDAMKLLGHRAHTAKRLARTFLKHDEKNLKKLASIRNQEEYINTIKQYIREIESIVQADADGPSLVDTAWDPETLREEVKTMSEIDPQTRSSHS